jgi:hypothetical protein
MQFARFALGSIATWFMADHCAGVGECHDNPEGHCT